LSGDAATACREFTATGGVVHPWNGNHGNHGNLRDADLLVDAILGSGLKRNLEGSFAEAAGQMDGSGAPVLSLDIPSGICGDTGRVLGCAVRADRTITFVGLKSGLFLADGPDFAGKLSYADLGVPESCRQSVSPVMRLIGDEAIERALPPRRRSAHKGDSGHLLLVGGAPGMAGAIRLSGEAALRCGAGRVSIVTHPSHCPALAAARPELMCHGVETESGLRALLARVSTVAIGPGLGTGDWGRALWRAVLDSELPMVVDADGLNLLAENPRSCDHWILTPHPGEAARLLGVSVADIQLDRVAALAELKRRYGGAIVLKGAGTLVSAASGAPWLCGAGNPGMATAGMGDVLTGVVGALLAQGLTLEQAAMCGVEVHARAGDDAAGNTPRGLLASDLLAGLRKMVNP
jgi:NAD(P)H-hydrate epimerase